MTQYNEQATCGNTIVPARSETPNERLIRRVSRDKRITNAHAKAALDANGFLKEPRDE